MSHAKLSFSTGRALRRSVIAAAVVGAAFALQPQTADAAVARVRWLPQDANATHYAVYVREAGKTYDVVPQWTGNPAPAEDGTISADVSFTPAATGANFFAVVAVDSATESPLSGELPTGWANPCRNDHCPEKTACDFGLKPDGASCDDVSFCNGAETCWKGVCAVRTPRNCADQSACTVDACDEIANACSNVPSAECCAECSSGDPCVAEACAAGECPASAGIDLDVERMRFTSRRVGIDLAVRGRFPADTAIDPTASGATLELRSADGVVLYSSTVGPDLFESDPEGQLYRFRVSRSAAEDLEMGLRRLELRLVNDAWVVNANLRTADLADAFSEPTVSVMVRLGDTCVRRVHTTCEHRAHVAKCG